MKVGILCPCMREKGSHFSGIFGVYRSSHPTHRDHFPFRGHEGWPIAEPQLGLQGVEIDLKLALFLDLGGLVQAAVVPEILQFLLHGLHGVLWGPVLQPGDGATNPLQQLEGAMTESLELKIVLKLQVLL